MASRTVSTSCGRSLTSNLNCRLTAASTSCTTTGYNSNLVVRSICWLFNAWMGTTPGTNSAQIGEPLAKASKPARGSQGQSKMGSSRTGH